MYAGVNYLEFDDLFSAWVGINWHLVKNELKVAVPGLGGYSGPSLYAYNVYVRVKSCKTYKEDWDISKSLGYTKKKWTTLVRNYVDMNYVDMLKNEINSRRNKNSRNYNYSLHFRNKYGSGKDCLVCLNLTYRLGIDYPIVIFTVRTSEITKRLIFDFVLVQRIVEYIYGPDTHVEMHFTAPTVFLNVESFTLMNNVRSIRKLLDKIPTENRGSLWEQIDKTFTHFMTADPETITWKSNRRSAIHIQRDEKGKLKHQRGGLPLKDLLLEEGVEILPETIITKYQKQQYKKKNGENIS